METRAGRAGIQGGPGCISDPGKGIEKVVVGLSILFMTSRHRFVDQAAAAMQFAVLASGAVAAAGRGEPLYEPQSGPGDFRQLPERQLAQSVPIN